MSGFTSRREQRLWLSALVVLVAIYSTVGSAGTLARVLRERHLLDAAFVLAFVTSGAVVVGSALWRRSGRHELWVTISVIAVCGMVVVRMGVGPEERSHLFEYGLLALLVHAALRERRHQGRRVPSPAVLAILVTALLGWGDEGIQAVLPNRVYDIRDVGINALAALVAVTASLAITRARQWDLFRNRRI